MIFLDLLIQLRLLMHQTVSSSNKKTHFNLMAS